MVEQGLKAWQKMSRVLHVLGSLHSLVVRGVDPLLLGWRCGLWEGWREGKVLSRGGCW